MSSERAVFSHLREANPFKGGGGFPHIPKPGRTDSMSVEAIRRAAAEFSRRVKDFEL